MGGFCGSNDKVAADYFDPLGPNAQGQQGPTGGPEARAGIFNALQSSIYPRAQQGAEDAVAGTRAAAASPTWGKLQGYLGNTLGGSYLRGNPSLDRAASSARTNLNTGLNASRAATTAGLQATRAQAGADLAGQQAATRSAMTRSGQRFGTAGQQAQEATKAAMNAQIGRGEQQATVAQQGTEASARSGLEAQLAQQNLQNYQNERQAQQGAAALAPSATSSQAQLLQAIPGLEYAGVAPTADIVRALAGGGQAVQPTMVRSPGVMDYVGQVAGIAGMAGY